MITAAAEALEEAAIPPDQLGDRGICGTVKERNGILRGGVCELLHGHSGWHRDDGMTWTERLDELPRAFTQAAVDAAYQRGLAEGEAERAELRGALEETRLLLEQAEQYARDTQDELLPEVAEEAHQRGIGCWPPVDWTRPTRDVPPHTVRSDASSPASSAPGRPPSSPRRPAMPNARTQRAVDAVTAAWPPLAGDPVYVEQLVLIALRAADGPAPETDPGLPAWIVEAVRHLHRDDQGDALGFAATGYVAGRNAELAAEQPEPAPVVDIAPNPRLHAHEVGGPQAGCADCDAKAAAEQPEGSDRG
jgi:hypothetical protein